MRQLPRGLDPSPHPAARPRRGLVCGANGEGVGEDLGGRVDTGIGRDLVFAGGAIGLKILDHLIIGNNRYYSFAGERLISQYEMDFLGLKMKGGG